MAKILGKGNFEIRLCFYAHGEWHNKVMRKKTLKGAYVLARVIQHNYNGALYWFTLLDYDKCKVRWHYDGETKTSKYCNRLMLREGQFNGISGYKSIMQGA